MIPENVPILQLNGVEVVSPPPSSPTSKKKRSSSASFEWRRKNKLRGLLCSGALGRCFCDGWRDWDSKKYLDVLHQYGQWQKEVHEVVEKAADAPDTCSEANCQGALLNALVSIDHEVSNPQSTVIEGHDCSDCVSEADSACSLSSSCSTSSTASVEYDFDSQKSNFAKEADRNFILDHAPHHYDFKNGFLEPTWAENVPPPKRGSKVGRITRRVQPLEGFLRELFEVPKEALDTRTMGLRREWLLDTRPEFFTKDGYLQEYVIHRARPQSMSKTMWLWLVGRDDKLPQFGPDSASLKLIAARVVVGEQLSPSLAMRMLALQPNRTNFWHDDLSEVDFSNPLSKTFQTSTFFAATPENEEEIDKENKDPAAELPDKTQTRRYHQCFMVMMFRLAPFYSGMLGKEVVQHILDKDDRDVDMFMEDIDAFMGEAARVAEEFSRVRSAEQTGDKV